MFHLSLPVREYEACIVFYRDYFGAKIVPLRPGATNVFVFGGQLTLHDKAASRLTDEARREMHFGQVVTPEEWGRLRDGLAASRHLLFQTVAPRESRDGRGKLLVADPSGNLVEINSFAAGA